MTFVEFEPRFAEAYRRFREALAGNAVDAPPRMPFAYYRPSPGITIRRHLLVDEAAGQTSVIAAADIKLQRYVLGAGTVEIAAVVYPVSLGTVDAAYRMAGVFLFRKLSEHYPLNFMLGMGSPEQSAAARLGRAMGWTLRPIPYCFLPIRVGPLLHKRLAEKSIPAAAVRGADRMGLFRPADALLRAKSWRLRRTNSGTRVSRVARFDDSFDGFWQAYSAEVGFSLVRDADQLNAIFPETIAAFEKLVVHAGERLVGYAVLLVPAAGVGGRFSDARVATLVDVGLLRAHMPDGMEALRHFFLRREVDAIITNASHDATRAHLGTIGFVPRPTSMYLAASKQLEALFIAHGIAAGDMVITRADGDGPIGLGVDL